MYNNKTPNIALTRDTPSIRRMTPAADVTSWDMFHEKQLVQTYPECPSFSKRKGRNPSWMNKPAYILNRCIEWSLRKFPYSLDYLSPDLLH